MIEKKNSTVVFDVLKFKKKKCVGPTSALIRTRGEPCGRVGRGPILFARGRHLPVANAVDRAIEVHTKAVPVFCRPFPTSVCPSRLAVYFGFVFPVFVKRIVCAFLSLVYVSAVYFYSYDWPSLYGQWTCSA